ncbi:MFS transporter [Telmatocola sphagniphila]|uniref:MFS transporter n=1 Tax=Telmatocola sphagniphila TaxID=1123043 RepID=A0A8E6B919_9BACT|nr:MFS transporter [Telmatocola sphagniphila]QVL33644.1 MFS transporter [Telmatocola sphagniphila]
MPSPFRSLRHRNYRLYFFGQGFSLIGSWMQTTTLAWLAWDWTKEARWPAFLLVAQIAPTLFLASWAGNLADRLPRHKLILRTQCAFLLSASLMTLLITLNLVNIVSLLALSVLHGCIQAIDLPVRLTFVPSLVEKEDILNTVALNSMQFNVARAIGPALAGVLLSSFSPGICLLGNTLSYLAVIISLLRMRDLKPEFPKQKSERDLQSGWSYLKAYPQIRQLLILSGAVSICGWPLLSLLTAYVERNLGLKEQAYGWLLSSVGGGAILAALNVASFGTSKRRRQFLRFGTLCVSLGLFILGSTQEFAWASLGCGLFGFGMISFLATGQGYVQLSVEDSHRGKVMGVWAMMVACGVPAGNLIWGPLADLHGITPIILGQASLMALIALILFRLRV